MKEHELKTWPDCFEAMLRGEKRFEVRRNDRAFEKGDVLFLREFDPASGRYSGRQMRCNVLYVLQGGQFGVESGFCVMSVAVIEERLHTRTKAAHQEERCASTPDPAAAACGASQAMVGERIVEG